jgi:antitoxin YefM
VVIYKTALEEIVMNAITLNQAQRDLKGVIEKVLADTEPIIISTDEGESIVLLPLADYNAWQETLYLLSNPANAAHLRQSIAEANNNQHYNCLPFSLQIERK